MGPCGISKRYLKLPQFLGSREQIFIKQPFTLKGSEAKHLKAAKRIKPGQDVRIADGRGNVIVAKVLRADKAEVLLEPIAGPFFMDDCIPVTMLLSLTKSERFDFAISKLSEIGVKEIYPVFTKRSLLTDRNSKRLKHKLQRWQKLCFESLKQSRGFKATKVHFPRDLAEVIIDVDIDRFSKKIVLWEDEDEFKRPSFDFSEDDSYLIAIGPEGGFSPEDMKIFRSNGFISYSMGQRILRSETASIFIASILKYAYMNTMERL